MARLLDNETDSAVVYIAAQPAPGEIAPAGALDDAIKKMEESLEHVLAVAGAIGCR